MKFSTLFFGLMTVVLAACSAQPAIVPITGSQTMTPQTTQIISIPQVSGPPAATPSSDAAPNPLLALPVLPTTILPTPTTPAVAIVCTPPAVLSPALTEGPYFKAGSPESASLAGSLPGLRLVLTGYVLDANCQPVAHALLDFWQADSRGVYDNNGYTLRGHQYTAADGSYRLETVVPGLYPGRTEHIHFKAQAPGGPLLTSQLFFPGVAQNSADGIYDPRLLINVQPVQNNQLQASLNIIIATR